MTLSRCTVQSLSMIQVLWKFNVLISKSSIDDDLTIKRLKNPKEYRMSHKTGRSLESTRVRGWPEVIQTDSKPFLALYQVDIHVWTPKFFFLIRMYVVLTDHKCFDKDFCLLRLVFGREAVLMLYPAIIIVAATGYINSASGIQMLAAHREALVLCAIAHSKWRVVSSAQTRRAL